MCVCVSVLIRTLRPRQEENISSNEPTTRGDEQMIDQRRHSEAEAFSLAIATSAAYANSLCPTLATQLAPTWMHMLLLKCPASCNPPRHHEPLPPPSLTGSAITKNPQWFSNEEPAVSNTLQPVKDSCCPMQQSRYLGHAISLPPTLPPPFSLSLSLSHPPPFPLTSLCG